MLSKATRPIHQAESNRCESLSLLRHEKLSKETRPTHRAGLNRNEKSSSSSSLTSLSECCQQDTRTPSGIEPQRKSCSSSSLASPSECCQRDPHPERDRAAARIKFFFFSHFFIRVLSKATRHTHRAESNRCESLSLLLHEKAVKGNKTNTPSGIEPQRVVLLLLASPSECCQRDPHPERD